MPTKSFFVAIAADLRIDLLNLKRDATNPSQAACIAGFDLAVSTMCDGFKRANPAFDRQRFRDAINKA